MKNILLLFFSILSYLNILCQNAVIKYKTRMYNEKDQILLPVKYMNDEVYFQKNNIVVSPYIQVNTYENVGKDFERIEFKTLYYEYRDLKTKKNFFFDSFNLNAKLVKPIKLDDTTFMTKLGNLNYKVSNVLNYKKVYLTDTSINNVTHKRFTIDFPVVKNRDSSTFKQIFYTRCDIKNKILHIDSHYDSINTCQIVRMDFKAGENPFWIVRYIEYERFYLTKEEKAIFRKWKRRAKKYKSK